ncbi:hypothetical protein K1719_035251 [Acacia pycnantha]|nr:hypothetical protein K1719_035251 [Acacia pycnantha]
MKTPGQLCEPVFNGTKPYWRSGPWNGREFLGVIASSYIDGFSLRQYNGTYYISFDLENPSIFVVFKLSSTGTIIATGWINKKEVGRWIIIPRNECDLHGTCGEFGFCNPLSTPICSCLDGFEPKNPEEWNKQNWTNGCIRKAPLQCDKRIKNGSQDGFKELVNMKTPNFLERLQVPAENCSRNCLQNCSCTAYEYDALIGCMSWSVKLIDTQTFASGGVDLYIHLANSELEKQSENVADQIGDSRRKKRKLTVIAICILIGATFLAACSYFLWTVVTRSKVGSKKEDEVLQEVVREHELADKTYHYLHRLIKLLL